MTREVVQYVPSERRYVIPEFKLPDNVTVPAADSKRWLTKFHEAHVRLSQTKNPRRRKKHLRDVRRYYKRAFRRVRVVS